jgi:ubiquinone/menaquinone biosynthesis C-methylase UbiE
MKVREFLDNKLREEVLMYERNFKDLDTNIYNEILDRWSKENSFSEEHRFVHLNRFIPDLKAKRILDMAAGCGSFVLQGLLNGYDVYGVEPEAWKQKLIDLKFSENNYPKEWRERILSAIGEDLPFPDGYFDVFDSWQTIEHVQDEQKCIQELHRVLKPGGMGILRGPDYICFHEGHYRMLWFPLLNPKSKLAKWYVSKLRKRPIAGLDTFHPVNPFILRRFCKKAGFKIVDLKKEIIYQAACRRVSFLKMPIFKPFLLFIYYLWDFYFWFKKLGQEQATVNYLLIKK